MKNLDRRDIIKYGIYGTCTLAVTGCATSGGGSIVGGLNAGTYGRINSVTGTGTATTIPQQTTTENKPQTLISALNIQVRNTWTQQRISGEFYPMAGIQRITVHHSGDVYNDTSATGTRQHMESVRRYHVNNNKWADIGYHYIIDPAGRIWEGRNRNNQGAHVRRNNEHNLGICLLGNFNTQQPTAAAMNKLQLSLIAFAKTYSVAQNKIYTHKEFNPTECPGANLQNSLGTRGGHDGLRGEVRKAL